MRNTAAAVETARTVAQLEMDATAAEAEQRQQDERRQEVRRLYAEEQERQTADALARDAARLR